MARVVAPPGIAPGPSVSESDALADYATRQLRMVAREGSAPSISGCRPDVMLFHHRAVEARLAKLAAGAGLAPAYAPSKGAVLRIRRPGNEVVARQGNAPCSTD